MKHNAKGVTYQWKSKGENRHWRCRNQPFTYYYFIIANGIAAGAIRVVDKHEYSVTKRISPVFVMPEYRNRGLAQKAIKLAEEKHGCSNWELETILEEKENCYLYEKMGYKKTDKIKIINKKLTLICYEKTEQWIKFIVSLKLINRLRRNKFVHIDEK